MSHSQLFSRLGVSALSAGLSAAFLAAVLGTAHPTQAALVENGNGPQLLIGLDDDNQDNTAIQAGAVARSSRSKYRCTLGGSGNDVMFGLNGNDVMDGGPGQDIILGGPDGGAAPGGPPNSDIMFGGPGNDVNLWAPGDGSEAFIGGQGLDALIFGSDAMAMRSQRVRLPTLLFGVPGFPQGIPTADVSGLSNFCTLEASPSPGYQYWCVSGGDREHHRHGAGKRGGTGVLAARVAQSRLPISRIRRQPSPSCPNRRSRA